MNININFLILFMFFIQQIKTQIPPVVPLTNALTAIYCHNFNDVGIMTIRCGTNEKIRMLDAFDVVVKNKTHLPLQCLKQKHFSMVHGDISNKADCKIHTSFTSACSGRENCTLHMQRIRLNNVNENCHNELVDYTMAFFECISDVFIHDICSTQAITSAWGTLKTPNFPNPYTSNDDCWCKLSTQLQYRLLLSVIIFQLIPYDQNCTGAGLYLQSSNEQRSTQCTYLQPGHNYLSDGNSLYINFYSRTLTVRGGFWIIYEASQPNAEVHLQCGPRKILGVPSEELFTSPPPVSSSYTHGWNRLVYNDPPNPKGLINDHIMHIQSVAATSRSFLDRNFKNNSSTTLASAFTYPYGNLTTFELAYGPRGWFLKYPLNSSNMTATKVLQSTTTELPVIKWNSTWRYIRRLRTRVFVTTTTTSTSTTTTTTTLSTTTITTPTTTLELTTVIIPASTSMIITTEQDIIPLSSTMVSITTSPQNIAVEQHLTVTDESRVYDSSTDTEILTTIIPNIQSTINLPASSFMLKTTIPTATPYYPPDGPFDWWQWQGYNKKFSTLSLKILTTTTTTTTTPTTTTTIETSISSTQTSTTTASTTRASTSLSARNRIMKLSNTTRTIPITSTNAATVDWFKWPQIESSSSTTRTTTTTARSDYYDDDYFEWLDSVETNKYQTTITTNPLLSIVPLSQGKQYQQMSFLPTKSNQNINNYGMVANTPSSKRYNTQQNISTIYGKDSLAKNQLNEEITNITEPRNKKDSEEYGWLSKTDMMIVTVSVLFVILLVFINIILFAVRRHRHRLQGRHLLSTSFPSSTNNRSISNNQLHSAKLGDSTDSLINITNNNNNDILPAVGEIVLWDEKDQGGYTIDNHGEWAKIEGRQWLANDNILENSGKLSSFSKSFRSHFQFMRQSNKKSNHGHQHVPASPKIQQQQISTFPLPVDTTTLSPVPEADDYQSSEFSSSDRILRNPETRPKNSNKKHQEAIKAVQALIHTEYNHSDDYYKRIESGGDDSNYTTMHENAGEEYSIADQQTDRSLGNETDVGGSVIISVPTMLKREDDIGIITDGVESIYNQNYSIHSRETTNQSNYLQTNNTKLFTSKQSTKTFKPITNNSIIVGHCQTDILPLDPKIFDKTLLAEHHQFYSCSQSLQFSTYDSGFFDDQTINSLPMTLTNEPISNDNISSSETNDNSPPNSLSKRNLRTIRQKQTYTVKL